MANRGIQRHNKTGFKGVSTNHKYTNKFRASIYRGGKRIHLGYFGKPEDAARAYDEAAIKYHGKFARLNFPND